MFRLTFPRALFISLLWHIICIFSIVIVISPASKGKERFSKINFIGAILDSNTLDFYREGKGLGQTKKAHNIVSELTVYDNSGSALPDKKLNVAKLESNISKPYVNSITEIIKESKGLPADIFMQTEKTGAVDSPQIKSEVATRQILFKPPKPAISRAFQMGKAPVKGEIFQIRLRFLVSPVGDVVFIEKVKSCGYPDVDLIAIRHMQKWKFAPLGQDKPRKNEEGIMLLELKAQ